LNKHFNPVAMRFGRLASIFAVLFGLLFANVSIGSASATPLHNDATASSTQHSTLAAPLGALDPNGSDLLIKGTIKNDGKGVAGIEFRVTGNGVDEVVTSDKEGRWVLKVANKGVYQVAIDLATLPEGVDLRDPTATVREANLTITNTAAVLFPLGKSTRVIQPMWEQVVVRIFAGLDLGLLLAVAAIGISLIFGTTGLNNFAHGEMVTLGALFTWLFYMEFKWPLLVAAAVTIFLTALSGWLQDSALWKPLRRRRLGLNQMMIVSIGFSIVARYILLIFFDGDTKVLSSDFTPVAIGVINTTETTLWSMGISVVTLAGVAWFLTRTRIGKATRAVSDNSSLAAATGIDVERVIRIVWTLAGALTGLAGILYGLQFQANWLTGFAILLLLFAAVTLGGLGTALGATVGAMIIGMVVELSSLFIPVDLKYAASLAILIVVLLVRPQGVLGKKQRIG